MFFRKDIFKNSKGLSIGFVVWLNLCLRMAVGYCVVASMGGFGGTKRSEE